MVVLKNDTRSFGVIACKLRKIFFATILLNHHYILTNISSQYAVEAHDPYFVQRLDFSSLQKITASRRILAYGVTVDFMDEYFNIGEATIIESLKMFVQAVISIFQKNT
jgi:hypothetical protein